MQKNFKHESIKKLVLVGVLSAVSFVLFLFPKFPILPMFQWLDIDFSDVPALFASVTISPIAGVAIVLIKNIIHLPFSSTSMVGEVSNFLIGASFVLATGIASRLVSRKNNRNSSVIFAIVCGVVVQLIAAVLVNYFIMIPMYSAFVNFSELGGKHYYIYAGVIPFNFIKDVFASAVFLMVYKLIYPKLHTIFTK